MSIPKYAIALLILLLCFVSLIQARQGKHLLLSYAPICEEGYTVTGGCISYDGIYISSVDTAYYFDQPRDWKPEIVRIGFKLLFDIAIPGCVQDVIDGVLSERCLCNVVCKKASTIASSLCEHVCGILFEFEIDLKPVVNGATSEVVGSSVYNDGGGGGSAGCFPSDAIVLLADGTERSISELSVGDEVMANIDGKPASTTVYGFAHHLTNVTRLYVSIETDSGSAVTVTPDHYVYIAQGALPTWSKRKALSASK